MATIWKRKDRDVWVVDYRDETGKRRRLMAATRQGAEGTLADKIKASREGRPTSSALQNMTLHDYVARWLPRVRDEIEEKTWRSYKQNLDTHILPILGHLKVLALSPSDVAEFMNVKRKARYGPGEGRPYSGTALRLMKAVLSTVLTDAVELEKHFLPSNPALAVTSRKKRNRVGQSRPEVNAMTMRQRDAFLAHARVREQQGRLPYAIRVMWELRVKTGMRPEEAYALQVGDIDLRSQTLRIERAISLGKIKSTKIHKQRHVDLSDGLAALLTHYADFVKAEVVAGSRSEPYWLFPGRHGGIVSEADERWHRDLFKHVIAAAQLPHFSPYDLRHTFASLLLSSNVPLLYVSKQLGHSKPSMTLDHYAKWLPKEEQRFVNVLDTHYEKVGTKAGTTVDIITRQGIQAIGNIADSSNMVYRSPLITYKKSCNP